MDTVQITGHLFKMENFILLCSQVSVFLSLPKQKIILKATSTSLTKDSCQVKNFHGNERHLNNKWTSSRRSGLHGWMPSDEIIQCKAGWLAAQIWKALKSEGLGFFFPIQDRELCRECFHQLKVKETFWVVWESIPSTYRTSYENSLKLLGAVVE